MFIGIGTVINVVAVVAGGLLGVLVGRWFSESLRHLITDALGLVTMIGAIASGAKIADAAFVDAVPSGVPTLIVLAAMLIGGGIGYLLKIEQRLDHLGELLRERFASDGDNLFVDGFVTASLIFVIGPLAILGSISDGLGTGIDQLALKSSLDFFAAVAFAASFGIGVAFSSIPVGIYQGAWTVIGVGLGSILSDAQVAAMTATGGLLLGAISLRLLNIKHIQTGTMLPALFVAPLLLLFF
jgi:uncharacterized membrane protein YqgA involved in biofilm formation